MKIISACVGKYMAFIILAVATLALFLPASCLWIQTSWINPLLMAIMFCMGMTLKAEDFLPVVKRPKDILLGCLAQFTIMPLLAFMLGRLFGLDAGLLAGVVLVGTCPGGTSSNVITYLSKGDVALSVGMTSVNTLLAPILTPAITYLLLKTSVTVDAASMFIAIVEVVIAPITLGFLITKISRTTSGKISEYLPAISVMAIAMIVASVVSHNSSRIMDTGTVIFTVVILHNLLGYAAGYLLAFLMGMPLPKKKALAVEIGMQNSGLATSLAGTAFPGLVMATVPGAIFSVWHNISGAMLANILARMSQE